MVISSLVTRDKLIVLNLAPNHEVQFEETMDFGYAFKKDLIFLKHFFLNFLIDKLWLAYMVEVKFTHMRSFKARLSKKQMKKNFELNNCK